MCMALVGSLGVFISALGELVGSVSGLTDFAEYEAS